MRVSPGPRGASSAAAAADRSSSLSGQLSALMQPFKLKLCRAPGERQLRDYSANVVLIEPLATFTAVEDFLWPRVRRSAAEAQSAPAPSTDSNKRTSPRTTLVGAGTATDKEKGKAVAAGPSSSTEASKEAAALAEKAKGKGKATEEEEKTKGGQRVTRAAAAARSAAMAITGGRAGARGKIRAGEQKPTEEEEEAAADEAMEEEGMEEDDDDGESPPLHEGEGMEEEMEEDEEEDEAAKLFGRSLEEHVHDVQLAASPNPSSLAAAAAAAAAASTSTAQPSAAAAAASTTPTGSTPTPTPPRFSEAASAAAPPRLLFSLRGRPLSSGTSIFQAIQAAATARADAERPVGVEEGTEEDGDGDSSRHSQQRLWDDVYPIHYSPYSPQAAAQAAAHATSLASGGGSQEAVAASLDAEAARELPAWALPVAQLLAANRPNIPLAVPQVLQHPLLLLRVVEVLWQLGGRLGGLCVPGAAAQEEAPTPSAVEQASVLASAAGERQQLVNAKVAAKLSRQLQDVLTLCTGELPPWCRQLTLACPFLFPFDTRRQFFNCTALGLSRALHSLQSLQASP